MTRTNNKTTTTGTPNKATITNFFNPITNIQDLTNSQPDDGTTDLDYKHDANQFEDSLEEALSVAAPPTGSSPDPTTIPVPANDFDFLSETFALHGAWAWGDARHQSPAASRWQHRRLTP
jgi:hypothetical protein